MATATIRTAMLEILHREHRSDERDEPGPSDTLVTDNYSGASASIYSDSGQSTVKLPVEYDDDAAVLNPDAMAPNVFYVFRLGDERYVAKKVQSGEIDVYGIQG